jgi:hypothetical protein
MSGGISGGCCACIASIFLARNRTIAEPPGCRLTRP